jgi:hypothetical protein
MGSDSPQGDYWSYNQGRITIHDTVGQCADDGKEYVLNYSRCAKTDVGKRIAELAETISREVPRICINSRQAVELVLDGVLTVEDLQAAREKKRVITCPEIKIGDRLIQLIIPPYGHALWRSGDVCVLPPL